MDRLSLAGLVVLVTACSRHEPSAPPSPLQDGSIAAAGSIDAATATAAPVARATPTAVKVVTGATAACALLSDATVRCWGANNWGQLGDDSTRTSPTPVMPNLRGVKDLVLGDDFACALIEDASVACWGKIGYGKARQTLSPTAAPGVRDIVKLFAIGGAACGTASSGALVCWGDVDARGHVAKTGASHAPTPVPGLDHVVALTAHAALTEGHAVFTWTDGGSPVASGVVTATELAERDVPCALTTTGEVACIADHAGCGMPLVLAKAMHKPHKAAKPRRSSPRSRSESNQPKLAGFSLPLAKAEHLAFATGTCVQTLQDRLECIDVANKCAVTRPWPAFVTIEQLSGSCARLANGTVRCASAGSAAAPLIEGVANAISISATGSATGSATPSRGCALTKEHAVVCWEGVGAATPVRFSSPH